MTAVSRASMVARRGACYKPEELLAVLGAAVLRALAEEDPGAMRAHLRPA